MELRVTTGLFAVLTVMATVWDRLGSAGQAIVATAAACAAAGYLVQKVIRPTVKTIANAADTYATLSTIADTLHGLLESFGDHEERIKRLEDGFDRLRRRVGTRDNDTPPS